MKIGIYVVFDFDYRATQCQINQSGVNDLIYTVSIGDFEQKTIV